MRTLRRGVRSLVTLALLTGASVVPGVAAEPFARVRLEPGSVVTVGQPVTVVVEVLVPTWFTGAPRFPALEVKNALALFEDRGANLTETIEGSTWAGQSRRYQIYPQKAGDYEIIAIPVKVRFQADKGGETIVSPPPVRFEAKLPPEARDLSYFISTTRLQVEQGFDRKPEVLRVGEAFTRTVTVKVDDALSMVIPPIPAESMPGLAVYVDPPAVTDQGGERGERIRGVRVERATYVAEAEGDYKLPALEITWWDVGSNRLRTAGLPAMEIHVEPGSGEAAAIPLPPEDPGVAETTARSRVPLLAILRAWVLPLGGVALVFMLLAWLWRRHGERMRQSYARLAHRRHDSEAACFSRLRVAIRSGDARATWGQWTSWLDRTQVEPGAATVRRFVEEAEDPELAREFRALEGRLFAGHQAGGAGWSPKALERCMVRARRRRRARSGSAGEQALPLSLN